MSLSERRRPTFDRELLLRTGLLWLLVSLIAVIARWHAVTSIAQVAVPLLTLGLAILLAARIVWRLIDPPLITYVGLLLAVTVPLAGQLGPPRIGDLGWLAVAVLAALNGMMARCARKGAWAMGISLGLGLGVSLELLPVAALFGVVLALRWLRAPQQREWLLTFLPALVLAGALTLLATRGVGGLVDRCDSLSSAHLVGLMVAALGTVALGALGQVPRLTLLGGFALIGVLATGAVLVQVPRCSPWPPVLPEPIWQVSFTNAAVLLWPPLLGLLAALRLAGRSHGWLRTYWLDHAVVLAGLLVVSLFASGMSAIACAAALPPFAWQLREWHRSAARQRRAIPRLAALFAVGMAALPIIPLAAARQASGWSQATPAPAKVQLPQG